MTNSELKPARVFEQFAKINQIPRPSKHEEKMIEFLVEFGKNHNLDTKVDKTGNVLITKPATKGMENAPTIILQSHIDMVCDKLVDLDFDFHKDAIQTYIDGEWLKAKGTTLGADDGIGVAYELAILDSDDIEHGKIECLFTVDEETGLTGAIGLLATTLLIWIRKTKDKFSLAVLVVLLPIVCLILNARVHRLATSLWKLVLRD